MAARKAQAPKRAAKAKQKPAPERAAVLAPTSAKATALRVSHDELRELLRIMEKRGCTDLAYEDKDIVLKLSRGTRTNTVEPVQQLQAPTSVRPPPPDKADPSDVVYVTSPFVGSFYKSATPESPPFVEVGTEVQPGQTLCIVEAMKMFNQIEADEAGTITAILVENGKSVEFGQRLFSIQKRS